MKIAPSDSNGCSTGHPRRDHDPAGATGRHLEAFLLLELFREPSYGYDLIRILGNAGFTRAREPGVVYRVLRALEQSGAIRSRWSNPVSGPARRYYQITQQGRELLRARALQLRRQMLRTQRLIDAYLVLTGDSLEEAHEKPEGPTNAFDRVGRTS